MDGLLFLPKQEGGMPGMKQIEGERQQNILKLTWPIFIELVLQMLVGNADQIMVGWYDSDSVGAIGNAFACVARSSDERARAVERNVILLE